MKQDLTAFDHFIASVTPLYPIERPDLIQVRGRITFTNNSVLYVRENYVTETGWIDYSYHWQTADHQIIHRWDNAHEVSTLDTSPFHQHAGSEENVQPSDPMTLADVLTIITGQLIAG